MKLSVNTHSFSVDLAKDIGLEGAILLQHFYYWYQNNKEKKGYKKDGRIWTYNSYPGLSAIFPYMNQRQIKYRIEKLTEDGFLIKGNYNKIAYDRTNWYALSDKSLELFGEDLGQNCPMGKTKLSNGSDEIVPAIPNIITYIKEEDITNFTSPENSSALFQLDSKHNWETILSLWITSETSTILNAVYKKYFLKMDRERQEGIVQFIKSLGSDIKFARDIWISSFLKNGSDLGSLGKDIEKKKQFQKTNNPINNQVASQEDLKKSSSDSMDLNQYL